MDSWRRAGAEPLSAQIVAHVERLKRSKDWVKDGGQFIPAPLVYLNNRRWEGAAEEGSDSQWWLTAGFGNLYEANNSGCYEHNAATFHDGKRLEAA